MALRDHKGGSWLVWVMYVVSTNMSYVLKLFNTHSCHVNATLRVGFTHKILVFMRERHSTPSIWFNF